MWKLIKLEWKKNNIGKYIRNAVILIAILGLFMFAQCYLGIANDPSGEPHDPSSGMGTMAVQIELFVNLCFLVFTSTMLASFVISSFKNKTMNLMFGYPIKRRNIVISQMLAVWIFNFAAMIIAKLIIYGLIFFCSKSMKPDFALGFDFTSIAFFEQIILKSILTVTIAFITLLVGRITMSSKATVISSFLLFFLMNGTVGDFSLAKNSVFPIALMVVAVICAFLSVLGLETEDAK